MAAPISNNNKPAPAPARTPAPNEAPKLTEAAAAEAAEAAPSAFDQALDGAESIGNYLPGPIGDAIASSASSIRFGKALATDVQGTTPATMRAGDQEVFEAKTKVTAGPAVAMGRVETKLEKTEDGRFDVDGSFELGAGLHAAVGKLEGSAMATGAFGVRFEESDPEVADARQAQIRNEMLKGAAIASEGAVGGAVGIAAMAEGRVRSMAERGKLDGASEIYFKGSLFLEGKAKIAEHEHELANGIDSSAAELGLRASLEAGGTLGAVVGEDGAVHGYIERRLKVEAAGEAEVGISNGPAMLGFKAEAKQETEIVVRETYELDPPMSIADAAAHPETLALALHGEPETSTKIETTNDLGKRVIKGSFDVEGGPNDALRAIAGGQGLEAHGTLQAYQKSGVMLHERLGGFDTEGGKVHMRAMGKPVAVDSVGAGLKAVAKMNLDAAVSVARI